jgi:hypothetical protein
MARKRHTAEEIVSELRQVDVLMAQDRPVADAVRAIAVTEVTYYRWRNEYGGLKGDQVKRLMVPAPTGPKAILHGSVAARLDTITISAARICFVMRRKPRGARTIGA